MDTISAVSGPALALLYLYCFPKDYKTLFYIAFIPCLLAVFASFFSFFDYWKTSPIIYRKVVIGFIGFHAVQQFGCISFIKSKTSGFQRYKCY